MAGNYNLIIDQGCTFAINIKWISLLTGYGATMQIRDTNTEGEVLVELSTTGTGITIVNDTLYIVIDAATTLEFPAGRHYYSLIIYHSGGGIYRVIEGFANVIRETTRGSFVPPDPPDPPVLPGAYVFAGSGSETGIVSRFNADGMGEMFSSGGYSIYTLTIWTMVYDGSFIYAAGYSEMEYEEQHIYKFEPEGLTKVIESEIITEAILALCFDETYLYSAGTDGIIRKRLLSDLSIVSESGAYGGSINSLVCDMSKIYAVGDTIQKIFEYDISDLSKIRESADYGGTINSIVSFGGSLFIAGDTIEKVYKYDIITFLKTDESVGYGGVITSLAVDGANVYAVGQTNGKIYKFLVSNLTKTGESEFIYSYLYSVFSYGAHVYVASDDGHVYQILISDMSTVSISADCGSNVNSVVVGAIGLPEPPS